MQQMSEGSVHFGVTKILEFILLTNVMLLKNMLVFLVKKNVGVSSPDVAIKISEFECSSSAEGH